MTKNNSNWKDAAEKFDKKFMDRYFIDTLHGCSFKDAKKTYKAMKDHFKPYFQEQRHEESVRELEKEAYNIPRARVYVKK